MVDRRTDMLPALLTETLCSLVSDVDRCTFLVIFEIDSKSFEIAETNFGKQIIRSRASLSYNKAQEMMDDQKDKTELTQSLRYLLKIARVLRDKRFQSGALALSSTEVKFKLDNES